MTLTIKVRKSHIERGVMEDEYNCPIAIALRDTKAFWDLWPYHNNFRVGTDIILYNDIDIAADLPDSAIAFISDFDAGEPVDPFSFKIEVNP